MKPTGLQGKVERRILKPLRSEEPTISRLGTGGATMTGEEETRRESRPEVARAVNGGSLTTRRRAAVRSSPRGETRA